MTPTQKDFLTIFHSLCRLHGVIRLHHSICDWNDGEILSIKMVASNHWVVTYASGTYYHYDLWDATWY